MTVPSATYKSGPYTGNGSTTVFPYGFRILDASHIQVVRTEAGIDTVLTTGFTVSGVGDGAGGNVTFSVAPTALQKITLIRNAPLTQTTDLENQGAYYAQSIEDALDLAVMRDQQIQEQVDRSLKIPVGSPISGTNEAIETLLVFGAIYLGASDVAPTVRNDGSALTGGELYFSTLDNALAVYTGTAWNLLVSTVNGTLSRQTYTATGGQTVFAINYDVGFVDVWLNGVKLVAGDDFTATNGTSITLTVGATLGDSVDIIAFGTFAMADMLQKSENLADLPDPAAARDNLDVPSTAEVDAAVALAVPAGAVMPFAMNTPPTGWLKANGAAVSRSTYAALFAAIGTTFGAGDGSTTFNLPDLRGEFVRGWADDRAVDTGRAFGSAQGDQNLSHSHGVTDPGHTHGLEMVAMTYGSGSSNTNATVGATARNRSNTPAWQDVPQTLADGSARAKSASAGVSVDPNGGTEARPRNIALLYCIKV